MEAVVNDGKASSKKIKVVDRRWFNEEGELRTPVPRRGTDDSAGRTEGSRSTAASHPDGERPSGGAKAETPHADAPEARNGAPARVQRPSGADFNLIVDVLAQQAVVSLTGAQGIEKNQAQARLFIDLLDILQEKTDGRLAPEEAAYLRDVLTRLRLAYVESGP